jgi:hypothetical protein
MPYISVPRPSNLPPLVGAAVDRLESHYLHEVHVMLRLPIPNYRLISPCTFSCTQALLALIGGASTMLYAHRDGHPSKDFKDLLVDFYPWDQEPNMAITATEGAKIIYEVFRNPIAHNLGADVRERAATPLVKIKRGGRMNGEGGLTEVMIERLESGTRPKISATVTVRPDDATVLYVEPLYWGVRVMLARLLRDTSRMMKAETYLGNVK